MFEDVMINHNNKISKVLEPLEPLFKIRDNFMDFLISSLTVNPVYAL